jgi:hypothetical protein
MVRLNVDAIIVITTPAGLVLQRQLRDVAVQDRETLFIEKDAKRKPQSIHIAFLRTRPRTKDYELRPAAPRMPLNHSALIKWSCLSLLERQHL